MTQRPKRELDATRPVRTTFMRSGDVSAVHQHAEHGTWMHVVDGEMLEERWTSDADGGYVHERRVLRAGQALAGPGGVPHRVRAHVDVAFVTTCACGCMLAEAADPREVVAMQRLSRTTSTTTATATGEPSPV